LLLLLGGEERGLSKNASSKEGKVRLMVAKEKGGEEGGKDLSTKRGIPCKAHAERGGEKGGGDRRNFDCAKRRRRKDLLYGEKGVVSCSREGRRKEGARSPTLPREKKGGEPDVCFLPGRREQGASCTQERVLTREGRPSSSKKRMGEREEQEKKGTSHTSSYSEGGGCFRRLRRNVVAEKEGGVHPSYHENFFGKPARRAIITEEGERRLFFLRRREKKEEN